MCLLVGLVQTLCVQILSGDLSLKVVLMAFPDGFSTFVHLLNG